MEVLGGPVDDVRCRNIVVSPENLDPDRIYNSNKESKIESHNVVIPVKYSEVI